MVKISVKQLIIKFIQNKCTSEEVDLLVDYFKNSSIDETFPEVEEVLILLKNKSELTEAKAAAVYRQILEKLAQEEKLRKLELDRSRSSRLKRMMAAAAIFAAIIGASLYFGFLKPTTPAGSPSVTTVPEDVIRLETADGKVQQLSDIDRLQLNTEAGEVLVEKEENLLRYHSKGTHKSAEIKYNTLIIPNGKKFEIILADGSYVMLNAGSSLKYPIDFPEEGKRKVFLTGEAYFKVARDEKKPFIVHTEAMEVNVLGTEFNVSAYKGDEVANVVLVEGSVNLASTEKEGEAIVLEPGQLGEYGKEDRRIHVREVDTRLYTAWMKGSLIFRNESFENILKKMQRHYSVIIVNEDEELAKTKFNANFGPDSLYEILDYFKAIYGIDYVQKNKDTLIIKSKDMNQTKE